MTADEVWRCLLGEADVACDLSALFAGDTDSVGAVWIDDGRAWRFTLNDLWWAEVTE